MKVLILAQEEGVASSLTRALRIRWPDLAVAVENSGHRGQGSLADDPPDVVFVSAALPDARALTLVVEIRKGSDVVIMLVGSGGDETDTVEALEAGADDYLSIPISESLLVARVCAALRRARKVTAEEGPTLKCGDLMIDPEHHEALLNGRPVYLTPTEFKLLYYLAQHQGRVVTQQALETVVWGFSDGIYIDVLRKHVQRLRRKLQSRRGARTTITTVPRVGYKLAHNNRTTARR